MAKTIIIGLGTTGLSIVNYIQKFHYEYTGNNKPENVEYIFCETDLAEEASKTASGENSITKASLDLKDSANFVRNYKNKPFWFPNEAEAAKLEQCNGAGGVSKAGRFALWKNWQTVKSAIQTAHTNGDKNDQVFIVGSFMGGTCTGTFMDIAYLSQKITKSANIYGFFLIPPAKQEDENKITVQQCYLNAISSMRYYMRNESNKTEILYNDTWPAGDTVDNFKENNPFKHVFLFSREYKDLAATNCNNVIQTIGMHLCIRIMDNATLEKKCFSKISDIDNPNDFNYSTIGTVLISHPLSQLQQILGLEECKSVLKKWISEEEYYQDKDKKDTVNTLKYDLKHTIIPEYQKRFEEDLLKSMDVIDKETIALLENKIKELIRDKKMQEIKALFKIEGEGSYYVRVKDKKREIRENLIDKIYNIGKEIMQSNRNINVLSEVINNIGTYSDNIVKFWAKEYHLSDVKDIYNNKDKFYSDTSKTLLDSAINNVGYYSLLLQKENFLIETASNILMLSKMHVTISILNEIKTAIKEGTTLIGKNNNVLLTYPDLAGDKANQKEGIVDIVNYVVDEKNIEDNVVARIDQVNDDISKDNYHFRYLFDEDVLEDIADIKRRNSDITPSFYDKDDILTYLYKIKNEGEKAKSKLFQDCLNNATKMYEKAENNKTINQIIDKNKRREREYGKVKEYFESTMDYSSVIKSKVPSLLKLRNTDFESEPNLQLVYAMSSFTAKPEIAKENSYLKNIGDPINNPAIKNGVVLSELKNLAILIYQQYSRKDNQKWIDIVQDIDLNYNYFQRQGIDTLIQSNGYLTKAQIEKILDPLKTK